ncbi:MAG: tetratricopeptide repeat protein [Candidatus Omnitrophota bacterium]|jgi:tetratricopeptide (TPR) repeat protein
MSDDALNALPKQIKDYYDKGITAIQRENFAYAVDLFSSALALKEDFAEARYYLWYSLWENSKRHSNIFSKIFGRVISSVLIMQAMSMQKTGKTSQAVYTYEKAMRADPGNTTVLNAIADCLISEGQTLAAIKILEGVPLINNNDFTCLKKLAGLYRSVENYDKARAYFSATLKVNPNDMDAEHGIKELDAIKTMEKHFENQ